MGRHVNAAKLPPRPGSGPSAIPAQYTARTVLNGCGAACPGSSNNSQWPPSLGTCFLAAYGVLAFSRPTCEKTTYIGNKPSLPTLTKPRLPYQSSEAWPCLIHALLRSQPRLASIFPHPVLRTCGHPAASFGPFHRPTSSRATFGLNIWIRRASAAREKRSLDGGSPLGLCEILAKEAFVCSSLED